ncbi:MAG TPA: beta-galactosidase [Arachnia sp.]|nr:beta-galactosidase [Arachnia sp.]
MHAAHSVLFGAAYYHEYQPSPRLEEDLDLMREAGFTVVRVGESTWAKWEPEDGRFELDWMQDVLDGAHARGISVILGTPTYAVPPWLARKFPEIGAERRTGQKIGWGARQEMDYSHPAFRYHAERVIRAVVGRYHDHPAVIGFQVDNEPGLELFHNHGTFQRFVDELRHQYGTVEALNKAWGLVYWSHELSTWADLWTPDNNAQPQYDLAWRRFQSRLTTEFIGWQADIVRQIAGDEKFVTTCIAYSRPAVDDEDLTRELDVTAGNPYYAMQDALSLADAPAANPHHWATTGAWTIYQSADRMYSSKQHRYLVTETNAGSIGGSAMNYPAYDGQWRQVAWAFVSRGASMVEYWHWHTLHYGTETYWGGVIPHDQQPGRVYRELARIGAEFRQASDALRGLEPDADVALLWSNDAKYGLSGQPALQVDGDGDRSSYERIFGAFYEGAFAASRSARVLHAAQLDDISGGDPAALAERFPVLVAAGLYIADDDLLAFLRDYAAAGGHLVLGPRTGYADEEARARLERKPALLADAAGASYQEFSNLVGPVPVEGSTALALADDAAAVDWIDCLIPDGAEALASYRHPHFGQFPAAVTAAHGAGRVTTVGCVPNDALAAGLIAWATPGDDAWRAGPRTLRVTSAHSDAGRLRFAHNWGWDPVTLALPVAVTDVLDGSSLAAGTAVELGPWDVRVFLEA